MTHTPTLIFWRIVRALLVDDSGQGLIEYALIIALMAIVIVASLTALGGTNGHGIQNSANRMPG